MPRNHVVEVTVLDLQSRKLCLQGFDVEIHRQGARFAHDESGGTSCFHIAQIARVSSGGDNAASGW